VPEAVFANQYAHLELLKEQTNTQGQLAEAQAGLRRADASLGQEQVAHSAIDVDENEILRQDLDDSRTQLGELQERLKKFADSSHRTVIRAPIDGSVLTLFVVTQGGVVAPGGTVLTLVPANDRLIVEAKLPLADVGFVQNGQQARLQLMASAGRKLKTLQGKVIHVSPDAVTEPEKEPYVLVRIAPEEDHFESGAFTYRLTPGAQIRASIVTGRRSVLGYLLDPFLSSTSGALMEP
jgi:adhesin transport system membrane fusion protein